MPGNGAQNTNNDTMTMTGRVQPGQSFVKKVFRKGIYPQWACAVRPQKAFGDTLIMGQNWLRLYSFTFTRRRTLSTSAGSNPWP